MTDEAEAERMSVPLTVNADVLGVWTSIFEFEIREVFFCSIGRSKETEPRRDEGERKERCPRAN